MCMFIFSVRLLRPILLSPTGLVGMTNVPPPSSGSRKNEFVSVVSADVRVSPAALGHLRSHSASRDDAFSPEVAHIS